MLYRHTALKVVPVACGQSGQTMGMFQEGEVGVDFSAEHYCTRTLRNHFPTIALFLEEYFAVIVARSSAEATG